MGTNYYLRRKIPLQKLKRMKALVTEDCIYNGALGEYLGQFKEIHIGKSSGGWQFLFNHNNGKYYGRTQKAIDKFLRDEVGKGGRFVDEYGEDQDIDKFWGMVESKKSGFDLKSYYDYECARWYDCQVHPERYENDNLKPTRPTDWGASHQETFSEDSWHLRFSDSTEFS